jgi:hypothetical protein
MRVEELQHIMVMHSCMQAHIHNDQGTWVLMPTLRLVPLTMCLESEQAQGHVYTYDKVHEPTDESLVPLHRLQQVPDPLYVHTFDHASCIQVHSLTTSHRSRAA